MFRLPLLGNGWADCIEIWYALGDPLVVRLVPGRPGRPGPGVLRVVTWSADLVGSAAGRPGAGSGIQALERRGCVLLSPDGRAAWSPIQWNPQPSDGGVTLSEARTETRWPTMDALFGCSERAGGFCADRDAARDVGLDETSCAERGKLVQGDVSAHVDRDVDRDVERVTRYSPLCGGLVTRFRWFYSGGDDSTVLGAEGQQIVIYLFKGRYDVHTVWVCSLIMHLVCAVDRRGIWFILCADSSFSPHVWLSHRVTSCDFTDRCIVKCFIVWVLSSRPLHLGLGGYGLVSGMQ